MTRPEHDWQIALVLGGARSGKSRFAEELAEQRAEDRLYLASAQARDEEMRERVEQHQARRGPGWRTWEEPLAVEPVLTGQTSKGRVVLFDCLTLWLSNLMEQGEAVEARQASLLASLERLQGPLVMVSNEVGLGIVPANALGRAFRDHQGRLNQAVAARADRVVFLAAGLPLVLKP